MRFTCILAVTLLLFILSGCGGSSTPPPLTFTAGNWDFAATSSTGANFQVGGNVINTGGTVTGTVRVLNSTCIAPATPVPITGNINGQTVTITSADIASQVITASLTGSATTLNGNYTITGTGCAGGDKGGFTGVLVPSISGTWKGTFTSSAVGNPQVAVTAPITEGAPGSTGIFPLTGTAAFSGSPCFSTGTMANIAGMAGRLVDVIVKNNDGSTTEFVGTLTNPANPTQMTGIYSVSGGSCSGDSGSGTLTKQ